MRKNILRNTLLTTILLVILISVSCKKSTTATQTIPVVSTTNIIINVTSSTAVSGGIITSIGDEVITANGVCWSSTDTLPTTSNSKTIDTINTGTYKFISQVTGLSPNTKYYLRAYAINVLGIGYGNVIKFTTSSSSTTASAVVTTIAGSGTSGYLDGPSATAQFNSPQGLVTDGQGNFYVSDTYNNVIRKISAAGVVSTFAGSGSIGISDGTGTSAQFYGPQGLAVDAQGNVFVADAGNNTIRKITAAGVVTTFAGVDTAGFLDGTGAKAKFNSPHGLAFDASGNLLVADKGNNVIRRITASGLVTTVSGVVIAGYLNASAGVVAQYNGPTAVTVDPTGNIYVADEGNSAIREINLKGAVSTIAGGPTQLTDVGYPSGIVSDTQGNLFVVDESGRVLEITAGKVLYSLAGTINVSGYSDGTGSAAQFSSPQQITIDASGNLYLADSNNNYIRKLVLTTTSSISSANSIKVASHK